MGYMSLQQVMLNEINIQKQHWFYGYNIYLGFASVNIVASDQ